MALGEVADEWFLDQKLWFRASVRPPITGTAHCVGGYGQGDAGGTVHDAMVVGWQVLAERYWAQKATIAEYCGGAGHGCGKNSWGTPYCGCTYNTPSIQARLVKHRCRMVQRGVHAQVIPRMHPLCMTLMHPLCIPWIFTPRRERSGQRQRGDWRD